MTPSKHAYYQLVAQNHKAALAVNRCRAVIHLENKQDEEFWKKVLKKACPNDNFFFIPASRTPSGTMASGCSACFMYRDFLDDRMAIAIDSDLRYLLQEQDIDAAHYILQTYTYSFENHLCFAPRLNQLPEVVTDIPNTVFDFEDFLILYSRAVYPLLLLFLYDAGQAYRKYSTDQFAKVLSIPYLPDRTKNNGECIINKLQSRISAEISTLTNIYTDYDEPTEMGRYAALGLHPDNAYLYVRGHNLFSLIIEIGNAVCHELKVRKKDHLVTAGELQYIPNLFAIKRVFEKECFSAHLHFTYPEIEKCIRDARSIWNIKRD